MGRMLVTVFLASVLAGSAVAEGSRDTSDPKTLALMAALRAANGGPALDRLRGVPRNRNDHPRWHDRHHRDVWRPSRAQDRRHPHAGRQGERRRLRWEPPRLALRPDSKVTKSTDAREIANARSDAYFTLGATNWPERFPATITSPWKGEVGALARGSTLRSAA
jgi:hypothetical protein